MGGKNTRTMTKSWNIKIVINEIPKQSTARTDPGFAPPVLSAKTFLPSGATAPDPVWLRVLTLTRQIEMTTAIQSVFRTRARQEFPKARIEGDGPFALIPCAPTGKLYLFATKAEAIAVRDNWPCGVMCFGNHVGTTLSPPRPAPPPRSVFRNPADIERD